MLFRSIITHNYEEAQKYCDTICFLEDGRVVDGKNFEGAKQAQTKLQTSSGKIKLIKGLAEEGLDEIEQKLITENRAQRMQRSLRLSKGPAIGFIPTDRKYTGSNPNLTIEQMLTSALDIPENQKPDAARKMIAASGVNIQPQEKCSCLSGGMLQKLMIEREFYQNPKSLILCNPLQGLDAKTCEKTCERIQKAAREGAEVLILSYGEFPMEEV